MNKCFITKLPSSVDNDNLPVPGQLRINWLKQNDLTDSSNQRFIALATNDSITVKVSGVHFTDRTLANNLGNTKTITAADGTVLLWVSNDADAVLTIDNKYSLTIISFFNVSSYRIKSAYFDIKDIKYCTNLTILNLINTQVSGDISALSNLTNLTKLKLTDTQVSGKIDSLANLTKLTDLMELKGLSLTGDMSKIPAEVSFIAQDGRKVTTDFTWTANSRKNATLLAMSGPIPFDTTSMDNMFVDQATCTFKPNSNEPWSRRISVRGTRTSASDAAVATIQNMGVTIDGVTKQA